MTTQQENTQNPNGDKLYAGKFKTVEELEAGYKSSLPVFQEHAELKKKFDEVTKVPDDYKTPAEISLQENEVNLIKKIAKNTQMTQAQYEKLAAETFAGSKERHEKFENAKKEIGADNLNLVQDFLKKHYGEKVGSTLLNSVIGNKELRDEIMSQREKVLNSEVGGVGRTGAGYSSVTHEDVLKARTAMEKSAGKAKVAARERYLALTASYANASR